MGRTYSGVVCAGECGSVGWGGKDTLNACQEGSQLLLNPPPQQDWGIK